MAEAGPGRLIAGGRSADVYEAGDGRVLRRYRDGRPADRVAREAEVTGRKCCCTGDLHPQNVILTADGPRIIDWEGAARGPAVADVAMTGLSAAAARAVQALFTRSFLAAAGPVDRGWLAVAVRQRLADPHLLPPERVRLERLRVA